MARVDFYILSQSGQVPRYAFACRLAEKAYRLEHTVLMHAPSREDAERLDDLLWTFRDGSFVPHHVIGRVDDGVQSPVIIGSPEDTVEPQDLLINLCDDIPACSGSFARIAELVTSDNDCKQLSRQRFAAYRDQGHTLETHHV